MYNTLSEPNLDMIYGFENDNSDSCLSLNIEPTLEFEPGITFYHSVSVSFPIILTGDITIDYPSNNCANNQRCVTGADQYIGITNNDFKISQHRILRQTIIIKNHS